MRLFALRPFRSIESGLRAKAGGLFFQVQPEASSTQVQSSHDTPDESVAWLIPESPGQSEEEVSPPSDGLETALALLRGPCYRGRAQACRMLESRANAGDGLAAFELGRVLQCGLGDIKPRPSLALQWLQHALTGGVHHAAPLLVEVAIGLGRGDIANLAAAFERAVAPAHAPRRRRVPREMRAISFQPEQEPQGAHPTTEAGTQTRDPASVVRPPNGPDRLALWAQRKAERAESARQWRLNLTPPASPDRDPVWDPNTR